MANTVTEGMNAIHTNIHEGANPQFCDGTTDNIPRFQLTGRYGKPQPTNDFPYYTARSVPAIYTITTDLKSYRKQICKLQTAGYQHFFLRSWDRAVLMYLSITNKMQRYTIFITINALHISDGSTSHHQELKTIYTALGICRAFTPSYLYRG